MILTSVAVRHALDAARYVTALAAAVAFAGSALLRVVMSQKHEAAPDRPDPDVS